MYKINSFTHDYCLASHNTYVVCVSFVQFEVDSEPQIFDKLFITILFERSEFLPEIC